MPALNRDVSVALMVPALACASTAMGQDEAGQGLALKVTRLPDRAMIEAFANLLPGKTLDRAAFPDAAKLTPRQIVGILCASPDPNYLQLLKERLAFTGDALDQPAGDSVHDWVFPACPRVVRNDDPNRPGLPGAMPRRAGSWIKILPWQWKEPMRLSAGQGYRPLATPINGPITNPVRANISILKEQFSVIEAELPVGQIVTFTDKAGNEHCGTAAMEPMDYADVREAWTKALVDAQGPPEVVRVMVVDNGFLGAHEVGTEVVFLDPPFWAKHFRMLDHQGRREPGPRLEVNDAWQRSILDRRDGFDPKDAGHGTHVTGLILGGAGVGVGWRADLLHRESGGAGTTRDYSVLQIQHLNVGNGGRHINKAAAKAMVEAVQSIVPFQVVNVSLSFTGENASSVGAMFNGRQSGNLFVAAAGNDGRNAANYFPANAGGRESGYVVTVGAIRSDGRRPDFSNWGNPVDVLAPGCNLASWLGDRSEPVAQSGTSMSAPIVTLQAALIRSISGLNASDIKARIIASGDLVHAEDRNYVWSGRRINIGRSLRLFRDHLEWRENDGAGGWRRLRASGTLLHVEGVRCSQPDEAVKKEQLMSLAGNDSGAPDGKLIHQLMVTEIGKVLPVPCPNQVIDSSASIQFQPDGQDPITINLMDVFHYVTRARIN